MKKFIVIAFILSLSQVASALTIKGTVTDSEDKPIVGASVTYKSGRYQTTSRAKGRFSLTNINRVSPRKLKKQTSSISDDDALIVTKEGYNPGSITITKYHTIDIHIKLTKGDESSESEDQSFNDNYNSKRYKLTYALDWQTIAIGTFVKDKLMNEKIITSSQNSTPRATGDLKPSWSKDGKHIAFMRTMEGNADGKGGKIWTAMVDVKTRKVTVLTKGDIEEYHPSWYRDGSHRVITNRKTPEKGWSTFVVDPKLKQNNEKEVPHGMMANSSLKDGTLLCSGMSTSLWTYNLDKKGSVPRQCVLDVPFPKVVLLTTPSVSVDETKITFAVDFSNFTGTYGAIKYANPDGDFFDYEEKLIYVGDLNMKTFRISNLVNITAEKKDTSYGVGYPRWSPDGTKIVYHSTVKGKFAIALYDLKTKTTKIITGNDQDRGYPCFQYAPM